MDYEIFLNSVTAWCEREDQTRSSNHTTCRWTLTPTAQSYSQLLHCRCTYTKRSSERHVWIQFQSRFILRVKCTSNITKQNAQEINITQVMMSSDHIVQGWRSRSGRPGDCQTNVLTEITSPTLCLQTRSPRIVCSDVGVKIKICLSQQQPLFLKRAQNGDFNVTHINEIG